MYNRQASPDRERKLLADIGKLSDSVRDLRRSGALENAVQIKELEVQSRAKWQELRTLRAGGNTIEQPGPREGGLYK